MFTLLVYVMKINKTMILFVIAILLLYIRVNGVVNESKDYLKTLKAQSSSSPLLSSLSSSSSSSSSSSTTTSSYIVHLDKNIVDHDEFHRKLREVSHDINVTHIFKDTIYGMAISTKSLNISKA